MNLTQALAVTLLLLITGCSSIDGQSLANQSLKTQESTQKSQLKNLFNHAEACSKRNAETQFCQCVRWAKDKSGEVPRPIGGETEDEYIDKAVPVFLGYFKRLEQCEQFAPIDLEFQIPEDSEVAKRVLSDNAGNILTPDLVDLIQPIERPVGWTYKLESPNKAIDFSKGAFQYKGKEDHGDLFVYTGGWNSEYVYIDGIRHFKNKKTTPHTLTPSESGECTFVIGACVYGPEDRRRKVFTKFENGIWIRNIGVSLRHRKIEKVIYDLNGIPLYKFQQSARYTAEEVRYESL